MKKERHFGAASVFNIDMKDFAGQKTDIQTGGNSRSIVFWWQRLLFLILHRGKVTVVVTLNLIKDFLQFLLAELF